MIEALLIAITCILAVILLWLLAVTILAIILIPRIISQLRTYLESIFTAFLAITREQAKTPQKDS